MTKIFCHRDSDGYCAGAIALREYPDAELIPIDYEDKFPIDSIGKDEAVFILDFSIEDSAVMCTLLDRTRNMTLIDHHKSTVGRYDHIINAPEPRANIIIDTSRSGCVLTWIYFHGDGVEPPLPVLLIEDMDLWKFVFSDTKDFIAGLDMMEKNPKLNPELWEALLTDRKWDVYNKVDELIKHGETINRYKKNIDRIVLGNIGFESKWEGYNCMVLNRSMVNSDVFESVWGKYDLYICYVFNGEVYRYSLYSDTVDVSVLAKAHGGGGHPGASGFHSRKNIFDQCCGGSCKS